MPTLEEIKDELNKRGYNAKIEGQLVMVELNPDLGLTRTYIIEKPAGAGSWEVFFTEVRYEDGEPNEEEAIIGNFKTVEEISEAIEDNENE